MLAGLTPGTMVSGYRVESRIGSGGMAVVFRARDESLGRLVALKVLAPGLVGDAEFRERFIRESRAAAAVDHPHIIPVYSAGEAGGVLYLAMRYVSGGDLRSVTAGEGPLSPERAVFLLSPVASALDAAHAAGLVHRDVKPANILVDTSPGRPDHPYLSDFGLAKGSASSRGLTGTGQFLGTPDYSAPEQIAGRRVGPKADQYALACVAYTILTGQLPFERETPMAVLFAHMNEPPPSVTACRPGLPAAIDGVLARALAKTPEDRFPTCGDFAEELRGALGAGSYAFPAASSLPPGRPSAPAAPPGAGTPPGSGTPSHPAAPSLPPADVPEPAAWSARAAGAPWAQAAAPRLAQQPTGTMTARAPLPGQSTLPPGFNGAGYAPTSPNLPFRGGPVPGGGGPSYPPASTGPAPRRRRRWPLLVGAACIAAAGGAVAGTLAALPHTPPPVLAPTGLVARSSSAGAVDVGWNGPASGPLPDRYEIVEDGQQVGSVAGSVTSYRATGLAPASSYQFVVIAVRGGKQSPVSAVLSAKTATPPLSAAALDYSGPVTYKMTSLVPPAPGWDHQPGSSWSDTWDLSSSCSPGACDARLDGNYDNHSFTMTLKRAGATYSGSTALDTAFNCSGTPVNATLSITIKVSSAGVQAAEWAATGFSGNSTVVVASSASCVGDTALETIHSG